MAIEILMPKLSDTMEEGKIIKWLVSEGDAVSSGDVIAEIETDKADMEYEVIEDGVLLKIVVAEGESVPVGHLIAYMGEEGEKVDGASAAPAAKKPEPAPAPEPEAVAAEPEAEPEPAAEPETPAPAPEPVKEAAPAPGPAPAGPIKASPVARRLADEAGVDIKQISGSGPEGRIIKRDVEEFLGGELPEIPRETPAPAPAPAAKPAEPKLISTETPPPAMLPPTKAPAGRRAKMSSMRKTIAKRLVESKVTIPHFYLTVELDMGPVMEARDVIKKQEDLKISVNDFIIKAAAKALLQHPLVNAHIEGDEIVYNDSVDVGVAVALDEGLVTPYVRQAHTKSLSQISAEVKDLALRAKSRKLLPEEFSGGSFTISNLGMFGIDQFTAIINPPESTILAVGRVKELPVVIDGQITIGQRMNVTLSCDHRIVDGAVGSLFLATLKEILENPMRMLV